MKNRTHIHDLGDGNNLGIKAYRLITLLHIRSTHAQISCEYTQAVQHIGLAGVWLDHGL